MNRTLLWETGIAGLTVHAAIEVPLVLVLELPCTGYLLGSEIVLTVCFAADLFARFRAAHKESAESRQRYIRTWFWIGAAYEEGVSNAGEYLQAIYWTTTTLTTIGYGDITPQTSAQTIYTIIVQIIGAGLYGFIIGTIAILIANIDVAKAQFQEKFERIQTFLRFRNIPAHLQQRVHDYFDCLCTSQRGHEERAILDELPDTLRTEIAYHINREILYKGPIFRGAGEQLLRDIISKL